MDVTIYQEPCWLLEAAELVYGLVNQLPAEQLTAQGPYCIPSDEVVRIQAAACAGLSPQDPVLEFYFHGVPLEGEQIRKSSLGCCLLYSSMELSCSNIDDMARALSQSWHSRRRSQYRISGIDSFSIGLEQSEHDCFLLSQEIAELPVPQNYRMQLLEVLLAFDEHLTRVVELLRPVAEALPALMEPWIQGAAALATIWREFFENNSAEDFLLKRARVKREKLQSVELALRYISPLPSPGKFKESTGTIQFHMGVAVLPEPNTSQPTVPEDWEFAALRLAANPDRARMLRLMVDRPMTLLELSEMLGLNRGSVFRDLNGLVNARLLLNESIDGRNCYRTNVPAFHGMMDRFLRYIEQNGDRPGHSENPRSTGDSGTELS